MKRCAIFGSNGYLAAHLATRLYKSGWTCDLFDVQPVSRSIEGCYRMCDVLDECFWKSFEPCLYDAVFFFAGLSGVEPSFASPRKFIAVNELGLLNLLERLAPLGAKSPRIVFPSSRLVYKGGCGEVTEESPLECKSVYSANKIACEALLSAYHARWGLPYSVMRICVPYGNLFPGGYSYGTISFFESQARQRGRITVYGDGSCTRTFTHVEDICHAAELLAGIAESGVYNVGGCAYSLQQVAGFVARRFPAEVVNVPWPEAAEKVEMGGITFNSDKLAKVTGFSSYKNLKDFIQEL